MAQFTYLYPIEEYFNSEIERRECDSWFKPRDNLPFSQTYFNTLNAAIFLRYRQNNFGVNWVTFDDRGIHPEIDVRNGDKIIKVGMDFITHTTEREDGTHPYPDNGFILDQIPEENLVVSGFHMWDCVEKLAKTAHERGLDVLVDEDLTEFFGTRIIQHNNFDISKYPSINPEEEGISLIYFMRAREGKSWLHQDY